MASKKATSSTKPKGQSKTAFVLSQPAGLSAKEVSAKAKGLGMEISEGYVYTIRSAAKTKGKGGAKKKGKPGRPKGSKNAPKATSSVVNALKNAESQVLEWVIEHGAPAVQSMIANVTDKLRRL